MSIPTSFPGQQPGEKIEVFIRKHWFIYIPPIAASVLLLLIPLAIYISIKYLGYELGEFQAVVTLALSLYILSVLGFFITSFIKNYLDTGIITDQRIMDIEQNGIFNRTISEQNLIRVQDVTAKQEGMWQTFLGFGDIFIETAGDVPNFDFHSVPNPHPTSQKILEFHQNIIAARQETSEEPLNNHPQTEKPDTSSPIAPTLTPESNWQSPSSPQTVPPSSPPENLESSQDQSEKAIDQNDLKQGGEIDLNRKP